MKHSVMVASTVVFLLSLALTSQAVVTNVAVYHCGEDGDVPATALKAAVGVDAPMLFNVGSASVVNEPSSAPGSTRYVQTYKMGWRAPAEYMYTKSYDWGMSLWVKLPVKPLVQAGSYDGNQMYYLSVGDFNQGPGLQNLDSAAGVTAWEDNGYSFLQVHHSLWGTWVHVASVFNGNNNKQFYVNGVQVGSGQSVNASWRVPGPVSYFCIGTRGANDYNGRFLYPAFDEVRVFGFDPGTFSISNVYDIAPFVWDGTEGNSWVSSHWSGMTPVSHEFYIVNSGRVVVDSAVTNEMSAFQVLVNGGEVEVGSGGALAVTHSILKVGSGGMLDVQGSLNAISLYNLGNVEFRSGASVWMDRLTHEGGTINMIANAGVGPVLMTAGDITGSGILTCFTNGFTVSNAASSSISAVLAGSVGLTKRGAGTLTISGPNTYTGTTAINGGTMLLTAPGTLGATNAPLTLGGGVLDLGSLSPTVGKLTISAAAGSGDTIKNGSLTATAYTASHGSGNAVVSATLLASGIAGVTNSGAGMLVLTATNTYTGETLLSGGVLRALEGVGLPTASLLTLNGGVFETWADVVRTGGSSAGNMRMTGGASGFSAYGAPIRVAFDSLTSPTPLTWGTAPFAPGSLILNAASASGTVEFKNSINLNGSQRTITVSSATNYPATMSGQLSGSGGLTKGGAGTLTLSNVNTYSGVTAVTMGILEVTALANGGRPSSIGISGNSADNLVFCSATYGGNGGTLRYIGSGAANGTTDRLFTMHATYGSIDGLTPSVCLDASGAPGSPMVFTNTGRLIDGYVQNGSHCTLTLAGTNTDDNTLAPVITQQRAGDRTTSVVKTGPGTWVLSGANAYDDSTTISNGVLKVTRLAATQQRSISLTSTAGSPIVSVASTDGISPGMIIDMGAGAIPEGSRIASIDSPTQFTLESGVGVTAATEVRSVGAACSLGWSAATADKLILNGGTLSYVGSGSNGVTYRLFTLGLGTTAGGLDASGAAGSPFALTNTGSMAFVGSGARTLALSGNNTDSNTIAAVIGDSGGATSVRKSGVGTWVLSGNNTYTGGTTVSGGKLVAAAPGNLPSSGTVTVNSGGNLSLENAANRTNTVAGLVMTNGAVLSFDWIGESTDLLTTMNTASVGGYIGIWLNTNAPAGTNLTLIHATGGGLAAGSYYLANPAVNATLSVTATDVKVTCVGTATPLAAAYWYGGQLAGAPNAMALSDTVAGNWSSTLSNYTATPWTPASTADVVFSVLSNATQQGNIVLGAAMTLNSMTFNDTNTVTINNDGYALTLNSTGSGVSSAISANETANLFPPVILGMNQTWTVAGDKTLTVGGSVVGGACALTKSGGGTLVFTGSTANVYGGLTTVGGGTLVLGKSGVAQAIANGGLTITNAQVLYTGSSSDMIGTGAVTINGVGQLDINGKSDTVGQIIIAATGATTNTTPIRSTAGAGLLNITTLDITPADGFLSRLDFNGGTLNLGGTVSFTAVGTGQAQISGGVALGNSRIFNIGSGTSGGYDLDVDGAISGSFTLQLNASGAGTLQFSGSTANTYSGLTTVSAGTLLLNKSGTASAIAGGGLTIGTASAISATVRYTGGSSDMMGAGAVVINGTGQLDFNGGTDTIGNVTITSTGAAGDTMPVNNTAGGGNLTIGLLAITPATNCVSRINAGSGILTLGGDVTFNAVSTGRARVSGNLDLGSATRTFTIGNGTGPDYDLVIDANISSAAGTYGLTKATVGSTLVLSGNSSYTGVTTLFGGVIRAQGNANALGQGTASVLLNTAATELQLAGDTGLSFGRNVTVSASLTNTTDTVTPGSAGVTHTMGALSIGACTLTVAGGTNVTSGTAGLTYGNVTLTGAPTFTVNNPQGGGTTLLTLNNIDNGANLVTVNGTGNTTITGIVGGGAGGVTKTGAGTLTMSGASTYTGATTVSGGTLRAGVTSVPDVSGAFGLNSAVTLANTAGVTLDLAGFNTRIGSLAGGGTTGGNVTLGSANLTVGGNNTTTNFDGKISGAGGALTKVGLGTLTLTSALNDYSGGTTVSAGKLVVAAAGSLSTNGIVTVNSGGNLSLQDSVVRTNRIGGLSLTNGATLICDWVSGGVDRLTTTNAAATSGDIGIWINPSTPNNTGAPFTLIHADGGGLSNATYYLLNPVVNATLVITDTDVKIKDYVLATPLTNAFWYGGQVTNAPNAMALRDTLSNWSATSTNYTATNALPGTTGNVFFSVTSGATQQSNIVLGASMTLRSLTFNDTNTVSIIDDGNQLTLNSTGTGSASAISANESAGIFPAIVLGSNQTWTVADGKTLTVGGTILGTSSLAKSGGGTLDLSGSTANIFGGLTTVREGVLLLDKSGSVNAIANAGLTVGSASVTNAVVQYTGTSSDMIANTVPVTILGVGQLDFNGRIDTVGNVTNTATGAVTNTTPIKNTLGGGNLTIGTLTVTPAVDYVSRINTGTGTLTLGGNVTFNAATTGRAQISGNLDLGGATRTFVIGDGSGADYDLLIDAVISSSAGAYGITKVTAASTLMLTGTNIYTGPTTINAGMLSVSVLANGGAASSIGQSDASAGNLVLGGGTLQYTGPTQSSDRGFTLAAGTTNTIEVTAGGTTLAITGASANTTGALTKTGAGTLTLGGANLHTGLTAINAGTLAWGCSNAISTGPVAVNGGTLDMAAFSDSVGTVTLTAGSITGSGTLTSTGGFIMNNGAGTNTSVSANLSGGVALTKSAAGTLVLSGNNTYSGATIINAGMLTVNGTNGGTGAVSVNNPATLAGSGTLAGATTVNPGGTLSPGPDGSVGGMVLAGLDLKSGSTNIFEFSAGPATNDLVTVTGVLTLNTRWSQVRLYQQGSTNDFTTAGTYKLFTFGTLIGSEQNLIVENRAAGKFYRFARDGNDIWLHIVDLPGPVAEWDGGGDPNFTWKTGANWVGDTAPAEGASLTFAGMIGASNTNDYDVYTAFGSITFSSDACAFTLGGNPITLLGGITNSSVNTQTFAVSMALAGTVDLCTLGGDMMVSGIMGEGASAGGINKLGTGTLTLGGANTYSSDTTVNAGTLKLGAANVIPNGSGRGNVLVAGTLDFCGFSETINGLTGAGVIDNTAGASTLTVGDNNAGCTFDGVIRNSSGVLALAKTGSGTLTLTGTNTYSGATTISAGILSVSSLADGGQPSGIGQSASAAANLVLAGGTLQYTGPTLAVDRSFTLNGGTTSTIDVRADTSVLTISGASAGTAGNLIKAGAGTLILSGTNAYSGATTVNAGILSVSSLADGGQPSGIGRSTSTAANLVLGGGTLQYTGSTASTDRNFTLTAGTTNTIDISSESAVLTIAGASSGTTGILIKTGPGTLALGGANLHTGATSVSNGTLVVAGQLSGSSGTIVGNGGTLAGTGTVTRAVTVSGTLAPGIPYGDQTGRLTVGAYTNTSSGKLSIQIGGTADGDYDQVVTTGSVNLTGTLEVSVVDGLGLVKGDSFKIVDKSSGAVTGIFNGLPEGHQVVGGRHVFTISYVGGDGNDVVLTFLYTKATVFLIR